MTVEPEWLGRVISLVQGRTPDTAVVAELARVLEQSEEVLPWLVLRQAAFDGDSEIMDRLRTLSAACNRASLHRQAGKTLAPESLAMESDSEAVLRAIIADNIAGSDRADTIGAILHRHNHTLPGRPGYDFRRRIVEFAPTPEPEIAPATEESGAH